MAHDSSITKPREGDLIYFPMSKGIFEIKFVEHQNPFYQLGKLYTYRLSCELFVYSQEDIDTGYSGVDVVEEDRKQFAIDLTLGTQVSTSEYTNFFVGETVFQVSGSTSGSFGSATSTATVIDWTTETKTLRVSNITGTLSTGGASDSIQGAVSGAEYLLTTETTTTVVVPDGVSGPQGDNDDIELEIDQDNIFDFSDTDPFSEGGY